MIHRKKSALVSAATLTAMLVLLWAPGASAGQWDERGKLSSQGADWAYSFDASPEAGAFEIMAFGQRGPSALDSDAYVADEDGLEGAGHLKIGGRISQAYFLMGDELDRFAGRRVTMSLWYKPDGTDAQLTLAWFSGDARAYFMGQTQNVVQVGEVKLYPTGEATSDGWVQVSSQPFDWEQGGLSPAYLKFQDPQQVQSYYQQVPLDASARVRLDAMEIQDLGPATRGVVMCNGWDEANQCGADGECAFGLCVDAAMTTGGAPVGKVREDYLARLISDVETFAGVRAGRLKIPELRTRWSALADVDTGTFWRELTLGHELLNDGHGAPPSARSVAIYNTSGICLGAGEADLLPEDMTATGPVPMVYSLNTAFETALRLERGDVLVSIDEQPVRDWIERQRHQLYYNGDVAGRDAMLIKDVVARAMQLGSKLTFARCAQTESACTAQDILEVEVDFAQELGDLIWANTPPADFYTYTQDCDLRFERSVNMPPNASFYYFGGHKDVDGIRHVMINGVPEMQSQQGDAWRRSFDSALSQANLPMMVLDQRTGYGGAVETLGYILGFFFEPSNRASTTFIPWAGEELAGELLESFEDCAEYVGQSYNGCGSFYSYTPTDNFQQATASQTKLAVLNGFDVSGNDYLPRFLRYRQAETRLFGHGPTIGAFGHSCSFSSYLPGVRGMAYQCHDAVFRAGPGAPDAGFESATGVMPDEIIYQRQSDALLGKDTMLEAARAWLKAP